MDIKSFLLTASSLLLAGCVLVNQQVYTHTTEQTELAYNNTPYTAFETLIPELKTPKPDVRVVCPAFVPPARLQVPAVPDFSIPEQPIEEQLATYIKSLRTVIKAEREALDAALAEHQRRCRG